MEGASPELVPESQSSTFPATTPTDSGNGSKNLTIRVTNPSNPGEKSQSQSPPISPSILLSPTIKISPESSVYNSPSIISPPSSAFVSALQSPYISPRAFIPQGNTIPVTHPSSASHSGSNSGDIPSTSYTPPEKEDFSDDPTDQKPKYLATLPDPVPPRISFSFPVPRISFAKGSASPSSAKLRSCDVYIGYHGMDINLIHLAKWLKSELEQQGIACFVADRAKYSDTQSLEIADRIICSATFGVVVVTEATFLNHFSIEEIRIFTQKKNLIPIFFDTDHGEIARFLDWKSDEKRWFCEAQDKEWREAVEGLMKSQEFRLETRDGNWRNCVSRTVGILKSKLGRKSVAEREQEPEDVPFPRNRNFIGREKEMQEIENSFFGRSDFDGTDYLKPRFCGVQNGLSENFVNQEDETGRTRGRFISLEMRKCKEPTLEAWIDPVIDLTNRERTPHKPRSKPKKSRQENKNNSKSETGFNSYRTFAVVCIGGISGIGKTELALEFAHRYSQRYKMVLWVGGESRYFRQNLLNLSVNLGLDVSAETQQERGRLKSFEEQEFEAFMRIKRELFRDVPYLLIIDNLQTEKEWWDGKDLQDLIPRNTGATHVIITTRLSKVMSFEYLQLSPVSLTDAMVLIEGKKKKDYPTEELDVLRKFEERLGRLSFGLGVIGSLLTELMISPSALFEAINKVSLNDAPCSSTSSDDQFCKNNPFLMKVLGFCFAILDQTSRRRNLASRMVLAGAWFAPSPVSATLLSAAAKKITANGNGFHRWKKCLKMALCCCSNCCLETQTRKSEADAALLLVKLGLARKSNKQPGFWIHFHEITSLFAKRKDGSAAAKATVRGVREIGNPTTNFNHLWASAFLVFGFKSEPTTVQLKAIDLVSFIRKIALPLAIRSFTTFSRCNAALELLRLCTNSLEEIEKSFVSQIQDWCHGSLCWKKKLQSNQRVDEYVWKDVTLLKATLLETRAKLLLRGGHFDSGEELCRTCISVRTVMLGHNHDLTLAAQETLAKLVRYRSKI